MSSLWLAKRKVGNCGLCLVLLCLILYMRNVLHFNPMERGSLVTVNWRWNEGGHFNPSFILIDELQNCCMSVILVYHFILCNIWNKHTLCCKDSDGESCFVLLPTS